MLRQARLLDALLGAGLVVGAVVDVRASASAPHPLAEVVAGLWIAGLFLRSAAPVAMGLVMGAGALVYAFVPGAPVTPLWAFIAILAASYTVGSRVPGNRGAALAGFLALSALVLSVTTSTGESLAAVWLSPLVIVGAPFAAGRLVHGARRSSAELVLLTEELSAGREQQARSAVIEERHRVAAELHDVITQVVDAMVVQAEEAAALLPAASSAREPLLVVSRTGREAMAELKEQLGVLGQHRDRPASVPGLADVVELARSSGAELEQGEHDEHGLAGLPAGTSLAAYRVVQEALTNATRHAAGAPVRVRIDLGDRLVVEVVNGRGRPMPGAAGGGHGIRGMRERAELYGGRLEAGPTPDGGWRVRAALPLQAAVLVRGATT